MLPDVDGWMSETYAPSGSLKPPNDGEGRLRSNREDPTVRRARAMVIECDRKRAKHLDELEAGIPADIIASRITATHQKKAAETVLTLALPAPKLTLD